MIAKRVQVPRRARKAAKKSCHKPPAIGERTFQVVKRGNQYFVLNQHQAVAAGPFKGREAAQKRADEMEMRAPR
jgi:hypothetical protein